MDYVQQGGNCIRKGEFTCLAQLGIYVGEMYFWQTAAGSNVFVLERSKVLRLIRKVFHRYGGL